MYVTVFAKTCTAAPLRKSQTLRRQNKFVAHQGNLTIPKDREVAMREGDRLLFYSAVKPLGVSCIRGCCSIQCGSPKSQGIGQENGGRVMKVLMSVGIVVVFLLFGNTEARAAGCD